MLMLPATPPRKLGCVSKPLEINQDRPQTPDSYGLISGLQQEALRSGIRQAQKGCKQKLHGNLSAKSATSQPYRHQHPRQPSGGEFHDPRPDATDVYVAIELSHVESKVLKGENSGLRVLNTGADFSIRIGCRAVAYWSVAGVSTGLRGRLQPGSSGGADGP